VKVGTAKPHAISEKLILPVKTAHRPDSLLRIILVKVGYHLIALLSRKILKKMVLSTRITTCFIGQAAFFIGHYLQWF
jgi:hypothetical protein